MNTTLNIIGLFIFLAGSLIISLFAARGISSMREYAQANKSLGLGALMATLIATLIEATDIGIKPPYTSGLISLFPTMFLVIMVLLIGMFVFPRLTIFKEELTMASVMHTMYGPVARYATVTISTLFSITLIIAQLIALGSLAPFLGVSSQSVILSIGLFITLYTAMGGVRAVAKTDIWQLLVVTIGLILFFFMVLHQFGGIGNITAAIPQGKHRAFWTYPRLIGRFNNAFFWFAFPTVLITPPVVQRVLMTEKRRDIRSMFASFALFYPFFRMLLLVVGFAFFSVTKPFNIKDPFGTLIPLICHNPLGQLGFFLALCGVCMSTMESFLNALAIMWVGDLLAPIAAKQNKKINAVLLVRLVCLFTGAICTLASLTVNLGISETTSYAYIILSMLVIPFFLGVMGFEGSGKVFVATILSFSLTMGIGYLWYNQEGSFIQHFADSWVRYFFLKTRKVYAGKTALAMRIIWLFAVVISTLTYFIAHVIQYGKFSFVDREKGIWRASGSYDMSVAFAWLVNPVAYARKKADKHGMWPNLFALFTFILFLMPPLNVGATPAGFYLHIALLRGVGLLLCGFLMAKNLWPDAVKPFFALTYYLTILYCIPFACTLTSLLDPNGMMVILNIVISMVVLAALVDWSGFLLLQALGVSLACIVNKAMGNPFFPTLGEYVGIMLCMGVGFTLLALWLFLRKRDTQRLQYMQVLEDTRFNQDNMLRTYVHTQKQLTDVLHKKSSMMTVVRDKTNALRADGADPTKLEAIDDAMEHFYSTASLSKGFLPMVPKEVAIEDFLNGVLQRLKSLDINPTDDGIMLVKKTRVQHVRWDVMHIENMVVNSIVQIMQKVPKTQIDLVLTDVVLDYEVPDEYRKDIVPGLCMLVTTAGQTPTYEGMYYPFRKEELLIDFRDLPMIENLRIVQAHYGIMKLEEALPKITHTYVLPIDIKTLRPNIKQFSKEDLSEQTKVDSPEDKAFLEAIGAKGFPLERITRALKIAKYYHYGDFRRSGEPFYYHPVAVAQILLDYTDDADVIVAALLHDTLEDTEYNRHQMKAMFGDKVTRMVVEVTHLYSKEQRPKIKLGKSETLDNLIASGGKGSLLIKLIDRLHNMRTLGAKEKNKQRIIAQETLDVFIPIAQKLAIKIIEDELRSLVKKYVV